MIRVTLLRVAADGSPVGREFGIDVAGVESEDLAVEVALDKVYSSGEYDRTDDLFSGADFELRGVRQLETVVVVEVTGWNDHDESVAEYGRGADENLAVAAAQKLGGIIEIGDVTVVRTETE